MRIFQPLLLRQLIDPVAITRFGIQTFYTYKYAFAPPIPNPKLCLLNNIWRTVQYKKFHRMML